MTTLLHGSRPKAVAPYTPVLSFGNTMGYLNTRLLYELSGVSRVEFAFEGGVIFLYPNTTGYKINRNSNGNTGFLKTQPLQDWIILNDLAGSKWHMQRDSVNKCWQGTRIAD